MLILIVGYKRFRGTFCIHKFGSNVVFFHTFSKNQNLCISVTPQNRMNAWQVTSEQVNVIASLCHVSVFGVGSINGQITMSRLMCLTMVSDPSHASFLCLSGINEPWERNDNPVCDKKNSFGFCHIYLESVGKMTFGQYLSKCSVPTTRLQSARDKYWLNIPVVGTPHKRSLRLDMMFVIKRLKYIVFVLWRYSGFCIDCAWPLQVVC